MKQRPPVSPTADLDAAPARACGAGVRGRPLEHGDLRLLLLVLIAERPRHGYELMRQIAALFKGLYTPSAGAIYPALAQLEAAGWVHTDLDAGRSAIRSLPLAATTLHSNAMRSMPHWPAPIGARAS